MKKKINWLQEMKKDRLDSVWYGGEMVEVEVGDYLFKIIAAGDVSAKLNGEMFKDKKRSGTNKRLFNRKRYFKRYRFAKGYRRRKVNFLG